MKRPPRRTPRFNKPFLLLTIAWTAFVLYINSQPGSAFAHPRFRWWHAIPHFDKCVHFVLYGVMTGLLWNAVLRLDRNSRPAVRMPILFIALMPALVALTDEIHQYFVPGRSMDVYDFLADVLAIGVVLAAGKIIRARKRQ